MLEDFIEANKLEAKLIKLKQKTKTLKEALSILNISPKKSIKTVLFFGEGEENFLVIVLRTQKISEKKLLKELKQKKIRRAEKEEVESITGYEEEFLPPVSVYGMRVVVDKKVLEHRTVYGAGGKEGVVLKISPKEIIECNEEVKIKNICS